VTSWRNHILGLGLLACCATAQGAIRLQADSLALPGITLSGFGANLSVAPDGRPRLQLHAAHASVPSLGWSDVGLTVQGELASAGGKSWKFAGHATTRGAPGNALSGATLAILYDPDAGTLQVNIDQDKSHVRALLPLDQPSHVQLTVKALPMAWLRGVLAAAWPAGRITGGTLAGQLALDLANRGAVISGRMDVAGAGLDSKSGTIAARGLDAGGTFRLDTSGPGVQAMFDGTVQNGNLLLGPLYAQLPSDKAYLHVAAAVAHDGVEIDSLQYDDHDALRVAGSMAFDARGNLDSLDLTRFAAALPAAYARYGTSLVASLFGLKQLRTSGSVVGSMKLGRNGPRAFDLHVRHLSAASADGSLDVADLDGDLDWDAQATRSATQLRWQSLSLYRLAFGPARLGLQDESGALTLRAPVNVALLGGNVYLQQFAWRPAADKPQRLSATFALTGVDMGEVCKAFGWPAFGGKLGGAVPGLRYDGSRLVFDGGLSLNVFGGSVSVTNLALQHPFGDAPQLAADIDMTQLDLAQLTGVFDIGQITGRLNGAIHGLRLVDWKPVAFAATLSASGGGTISQRALKSLTEVGGGGIAGGLQGMALRLFKTFGYSKIGLSCALADGVCTMGGTDNGGYTIVEGSGLPHVTVIGHQHSVDWITLVDRLREAMRGNGPVVR
jgi:hypothetical protein